MRFSRKRGGRVAAEVAPVEEAVLRQAVTDLLELLGEGAPEHADPLAALVGLPEGPVEEPSDPALARLLPSAYSDDLPGAAADFRRYTEADLRAGKRAHAQVVLATLPPGGGPLVLDRDQADAWLGTLNDLRLVLGTRLEVSEDTEPEETWEDTPRGHGLQVYGWLGWLQETLVGSLVPRRPPRRP